MKKYTWLFLFLMVAAFTVAGCGGGGGEDNPTPADGDTDTTDHETQPVDGDPDTADPDKEPEAVDCANDVCACDAANACPKDYACHPIGVCRKPECDDQKKCKTITGYDETYSCNTDGFCVQTACKQPKECPTGQFCDGGVCKIAPQCDNVDKVVINEGSGLISQGKEVTLTAVALTKNNVPVPGMAFAWTSDKADAVAVSAEGKLTGGTASGVAKITAKACEKVTSDAVSYTNFAAVAEGSARVVVFDQATGALLKDIDVYLIPASGRKAEVTPVKTDENGSAAFASVTCANGCTLHVLNAAYTFVSAFGVKVNDIMVPLTKNTDNTIADGAKGKQDTSSIPEALRGDVQIGISMFSIPGNLADLNFTSLIGDMIKTHVKVGTMETDVDLPSALEGYLKGDPLKEGYYTVGMPGKATLWGLGGYADLNYLIENVTKRIGDTIDVPGLLGVALPLFNDFYHGTQTGFELTTRPKVVDVNDRNKDGKKDDLVADIDNFKTANLAVNQKQTYNVAINYPVDMPVFSSAAGDCADAAITLIGTMQKGVGFVPLGIAAGLDKKDKEDKGNCKLGAADDGKVTSKYAPQHDGLNGNDYYTLNVAVPLSKLMDKNYKGGIDISGSVTRSPNAYDDGKDAVQVPAFLNFMTDAKIEVTDTHVKVTAAAVKDANFHRIVLAKDSADKKATTYWHIYWGTGSAPDFDVLGTDNRAKGFGGASMAQAVSLDGATYDDLFSFGGKNLTKMNDMLKSFSMHILQAPAATK